MSAPRAIVADQSGVFRSGVSSLLLEDAGYDVVEVDDIEELVAAARSHAPDIVLIDTRFGRGTELQDALPVIRTLTASVIIWSFETDADAVVAALQAGADGFLQKDITPSGLLRALEAARHGEAVLPRSLVRELVTCLRGLDECYRARERIMTLSERERQVLAMIASGARNRAIASALQISEFTVKRHVQNILHKLDLPSRRVAAALYESAADSRMATAIVAAEPARVGRPERPRERAAPVA